MHDPNTTDFLAEERVGIQEKLNAATAGLSPSLKDWFNTAITAALDQTMSDMIPIMEEKLIAAYAEKFTADELQQILDFQVFVRQPHIVAAMAAADAAPTSAERLKTMAARMPKADFEKMMTTTLKHPVLTMTMVTLEVSKETTTEFVQRFKVALTAQCVTAPQGIPACRDYGRAL